MPKELLEIQVHVMGPYVAAFVTSIGGHSIKLGEEGPLLSILEVLYEGEVKETFDRLVTQVGVRMTLTYGSTQPPPPGQTEH